MLKKTALAKSEQRREMSEIEAILYTRRGCHLCDDAVHILVDHGLKVHEVDIDADPDLASRYTNCVPVVVIDGKERFRGRVNAVLLRRLLRAESA
jgi:glutaredoxin